MAFVDELSFAAGIEEKVVAALKHEMGMLCLSWSFVISLEKLKADGSLASAGPDAIFSGTYDGTPVVIYKHKLSRSERIQARFWDRPEAGKHATFAKRRAAAIKEAEEKIEEYKREIPGCRYWMEPCMRHDGFICVCLQFPRDIAPDWAKDFSVDTTGFVRTIYTVPFDSVESA